GSISVQAWDRPQAEVKIIKRGNSDDDIQNIPIAISNDKGNLSIDATQGRNNTEVRFEIKLPLGLDLGDVKFSSTNGSIKLSDVAGKIVAESTNGSITLEGVSGIERAATTNGAIKATIENVPPNRPMEFKSTNGSIDVRFDMDFNAALEASTVHGSIDI